MADAADKDEMITSGGGGGIIRVPSGKRGEFILATKVCDSYAFVVLISSSWLFDVVEMKRVCTERARVSDMNGLL